MAKLLDESRSSLEHLLRVFQYIQATPLETTIKMKSEDFDFEEVKLLRRGRQQVRIEKCDGTHVLVPLENIILPK